MTASHSQLRDWGISSSEKIVKIVITFLSKAAVHAGIPAEPTAASSALTFPARTLVAHPLRRRKSTEAKVEPSGQPRLKMR
jgi:hypothetical protein